MSPGRRRPFTASAAGLLSYAWTFATCHRVRRSVASCHIAETTTTKYGATGLETHATRRAEEGLKSDTGKLSNAA